MDDINERIEEIKDELRAIRAANFQFTAERESETEDFIDRLQTADKKLDTKHLVPHHYIEELERDIHPSTPKVIISCQATLCCILHRTDAEEGLIDLAKEQSDHDISIMRTLVNELRLDKADTDRELNEEIELLRKDLEETRYKYQAIINRQELMLSDLRDEVCTAVSQDESDSEDASCKQERRSMETTLEPRTVQVHDEKSNRTLSQHFDLMTGLVKPKDESDMSDAAFYFNMKNAPRRRKRRLSITARGA